MIKKIKKSLLKVIFIPLQGGYNSFINNKTKLYQVM